MIKNTIKYLAVFVLLAWFSGCTGIYENGKELAEDAKARVPEISVDDLKAGIDSGAAFTIIDVRQLAEYNSGNIPGSVCIPRGLLEFKIGNSTFWEEQYMYPPEKGDEIIIYCKSGARGTLAAESLIQIGYTNVKNLTGGFVAFDPAAASGEVKHEESGGCGG